MTTPESCGIEGEEEVPGTPFSGAPEAARLAKPTGDRIRYF
jgi:hypothetical protein